MNCDSRDAGGQNDGLTAAHVSILQLIVCTKWSAQVRDDMPDQLAKSLYKSCEHMP